MTAVSASKHSWFTVEMTGTAIALDPDIMGRLKDFKGVSLLKKAAMNMLVKMAD